MSENWRYIQRMPNGSFRVRIWHRGKEVWSRHYQDKQAAFSARDAKCREYAIHLEPEEKEESTPQVSDTVEGNCRNVDYVSPDVRTLDDLIAACHIDLDEWQIVHWEANKWGVGAKTARKQLTYVDGMATGTIDEPGTLTIAPIFQVKARMVKRNPVAIFPVLKPVEFALPALVPTRDTGIVSTSHLIGMDTHNGYRRDPRTGRLEPFHDRAALDIVLQVLEDHWFNSFTLAGDNWDATEFTDKFVREPEFYFTAQATVIELAWWLARYRATGHATHNYIILGNHDVRLKRALSTHFMAAYDLKPAFELDQAAPLSTRRLLGLDKLGYQCVEGYPDSEVWLEDNLRVEHGDIARADPGGSAAAMVDKVNENTVFGHIHRTERATRTEARRGHARSITALCPGCLCRVDGTVPGHELKQNWQQGFAVAHTGPDGYLSIETVSIENGRAWYGGKLYRARESVSLLRRDVGGEWGF